ncbi:S8 family peptidase [Luteibaculum oceani]|uniref:S8 family peptidase n=2 Tax=Luteibaculum oceani TaxID=1294296 RepID=A0A5C6UYU4_9FLAO|nr:S8 family peptidase [Luteibaculum oceani]
MTSCSKEDLSTEKQTQLDQSKSIQSNSENGAMIPDQYIVVFEDGTFESAALRKSAVEQEQMAMEISSDLFKQMGAKNVTVLNAMAKAIDATVIRSSKGDLEKIQGDQRVKFIEPDRVIMLAPPPGKGKGGGDDGGSSSQSTPYGITRVGGAVDATGKTVWILDSGVDLDHPDLNVDVARSRTFISSGKDSKNADDGNGHGTHCAGTVAAIDNNIGVVGVAANATVVGVKVLDSRGSGSYSGVIAGVNYVASAASPGDVANMSLGGPTSQALDDAVRNAASQGILFALAAGNESRDANNSSPARVNHQNVYTISAMNSSDVWASFSNYGNPPVDYCAPGVSVNSTWKNGGYNTISGTSMAAPHAAGVLLITGGNPTTSGSVIGDPDGNADPIISH